MSGDGDLQRHLREERLPTMFCPGCGIGTVMTSFLGAMEEAGLTRDRVAVVTGIGCTGRIGGYLRMDSLHATHGRTLAVATGAQVVRPDLQFVAFVGDGDGLSIGGNHLIHAARRGVPITVVLVNNMNYGLTGGQASATTPVGMRSTTTPGGMAERPFDACRLVEAAGAAFVARWTTLHPRELQRSIARALGISGFSYVEVMSQCPPLFGRRNGMEPPEELTGWIERRASEVTWPYDGQREGVPGAGWKLGELVGGEA